MHKQLHFLSYFIKSKLQMYENELRKNHPKASHDQKEKNVDTLYIYQESIRTVPKKEDRKINTEMGYYMKQQETSRCCKHFSEFLVGFLLSSGFLKACYSCTTKKVIGSTFSPFFK